tara:strand:+ start:459 stop:827 length:369 start_codon:yes stop_codon:yes gene_type:complete
MTVEKIHKAIKPQDFNINIRPNIREDGKWAGDINVNILVAGDNPLDDEDYESLLHFTKMVCSSIPIMEFSKEYRELVHKYTMEHGDETEITFEPEYEERGKVLDRTGNVITISFGTETKGSA